MLTLSLSLSLTHTHTHTHTTLDTHLTYSYVSARRLLACARDKNLRHYNILKYSTPHRVKLTDFDLSNKILGQNEELNNDIARHRDHLMYDFRALASSVSNRGSGLLRPDDEEVSTCSITRDHPWQAPEFLSLTKSPRNPTMFQKSDIFSFGVVLSEIISMQIVREDAVNSRSKDSVLNGKGLSYKTFSPFQTDAQEPMKLSRIVRKCCRIEPDSRPSSNHLVHVLTVLAKDIENQRKGGRKLFVKGAHQLIRHVSMSK